MRTFLFFLPSFTLGLMLFLLSLRTASTALQQIGQGRLERVLARLTASPLHGLTLGIVSTSLVQSSSTVAVTAVALVEARILTLKQAVAVILGANIGTTMTAQLVSFHLDDAGLPLCVAGLLLWLLQKRKSPGAVGIWAFGGLLLGLSVLRESLAPLAHTPAIHNSLQYAAGSTYAAVAGGALITVLLQSSSAAAGLAIVLAEQDLLDLSAALAICLGSNMGTVTTTLIASTGMSKPARAAALADLLFNVLGVVLLLPVYRPFLALVRETHPDLPRQIANGNSLFNAVTAFIALGLLQPLTAFAARWAGISAKETK